MEGKPIKDYSDYIISNNGNIYSQRKFNNLTKLKIRLNKKGYRKITLTKNNGKRREFRVARLVLQAFKPIDNKKMEANHKDGNKQNDNINNLEWVTHAENMRHASKKGLVKAYHHLTSKIVKEIKQKIKGGEKRENWLKNIVYLFLQLVILNTIENGNI